MCDAEHYTLNVDVGRTRREDNGKPTLKAPTSDDAAWLVAPPPHPRLPTWLAFDLFVASIGGDDKEPFASHQNLPIHGPRWGGGAGIKVFPHSTNMSPLPANKRASDQPPRRGAVVLTLC